MTKDIREGIPGEECLRAAIMTTIPAAEGQGWWLERTALAIFVSIFLVFPVCNSARKSKRDLYEKAKFKDDIERGVY